MKAFLTKLKLLFNEASTKVTTYVVLAMGAIAQIPGHAQDVLNAWPDIAQYLPKTAVITTASHWTVTALGFVAAIMRVRRIVWPPVAKLLLIALALPFVFSAAPAMAAEVPVEKNAPKIEGHPLTSVVVTQCNLIVAVYMTMKDGRLLRFDKTANLPPGELMQMAYSAVRSERVEVSCNETGAIGYEKRDPV